MKNIFAKAAILGAMAIVAMPAISAQTIEKADWGDFKLFLDPGHSGHENRGLWDYSEAEKVLSVALNIKDFLETYTTCKDGETLKLCRYDENTVVDLEERSDMANAWGADFYYSIHSDASGSANTIVTLFGGWRNNGQEVEKTPNGGKAYGEILNPNLSGVMRVGSRGNWYDRCFYDRTPETHENQYPYLSVNRRSNMPSLLSEGGYHDMAVQQRRNMNADYKRLEAFAAFQSLMQYHGVALPAQTFFTGMVYNSENEQPINGARVTVDGKTYTTDTYESLFHKYTKNPDLIQNGFFIFEGLTAGQEYDVTVEADGFETINTKVTIKAGGATSADYVTFLDPAMTNLMPAKVASVSASDLENVSVRYPLTITFSRNMVRETVEQALSISRDAEYTLTWENDYTLSLDIKKLLPLIKYTLTIDGSIAKNSQTQNFLDGDGDGVEGGNYVLEFKLEDPDVEAPYVTRTYPEDLSEAVYTKRPPISIEFNEELVYNADKYGDCIKVSDSKGKVYEGVIRHEVMSGASVLTFYPKEDLAADVAVGVEYAGGVPDLSDNVSDKYAFRFLTEYRELQPLDDNGTLVETIIPLNTNDDLSGFYPPTVGGSGTNSGVGEEGQVIYANYGWNLDQTSSIRVDYLFDEDADAPYIFRVHNKNYNNVKSRHKEFNGTLSMWVFGDGSNNGAIAYFRTADGVKYTIPQPVNYRGWNLVHWNLEGMPVEALTGAETVLSGNTTYYLFDAVGLTHEKIEEDAEDDEGNPIPYQAWGGTVFYNDMTRTIWADGERTANIDDFKLGDAISNVTVDAAAAEYYTLQGVRVANPAAGIYIRRQGNSATKVLVK